MPAPLDAIRAIVGPTHVLTGADCGPYVLDGRAPEAVVLPGTKEEVARYVGGGELTAVDAVERRHQDGPCSAPPWARVAMNVSTGLRARAGDLTRPSMLADLGVSRASSEPGHAPRPHTPTNRRRRYLSSKRPDRGATLRACRDLVIGLTWSRPKAPRHGGGKVVKNVAGYDLPTLFVGAFGLSACGRATVKLLPRPARIAWGRALRRLKAAGAGFARFGPDLLLVADLVDGGSSRSELGAPLGGS